MMEDGPLAERAFETAEGSLDSCQQDIVAPDVFGTQVVAAAFEQGTAIEGFGFLFALLVFAARELGLRLVVGYKVVPSHPGITLLQTPNGFVTLGSCPQAACADALAQPFRVGQKPHLLLFT